MFVCREMKKLRSALDEKGIKWEDASETIRRGMWICRTAFKVRGCKVVVINGFGTYGGFNSYSKNKGLLEVMSELTGAYPVGSVTAEEVIDLIFKGE